MATYDVHQHLWPKGFVEALRARTTPPLLSGAELVTVEGRFPIELAAHDPEARIRTLDRDGIDVAVLSLQTSLGLDKLAVDERDELEGAWVDEILELVSASGGRFLALAPSRVRAGFAGVSLGASSLLDLASAGAILDGAAEQGATVFVHPVAGSTAPEAAPAWWTWVAGYPAQLELAYLSWLATGRGRWPSLRVVFTLLAGGAPFQLERLSHRGLDVRSALDPNTFFEVATYGRRAIELLIETFGVHQLVYGSDTPVVDSRPTLDAIRGFGDAVTHVLQTDTPSVLLR
jgi:6-methylsalicylate decarboxylase